MDIGYQQQRELLPPDLRLVSDAALILHLREFDLFRAAWQSWFARPRDDRALERIFVDYLFNQRVPHWVRHFARRVISEAEAGELDRQRLGVADFPRREPLPDLTGGHIMVAYAAALLFYLFYLLECN